MPSAVPSRLRLHSAISAARLDHAFCARVLQQREPVFERVLPGELRQLVDHDLDGEVGRARADAAPGARCARRAPRRCGPRHARARRSAACRRRRRRCGRRPSAPPSASGRRDRARPCRRRSGAASRRPCRRHRGRPRCAAHSSAGSGRARRRRCGSGSSSPACPPPSTGSPRRSRIRQRRCGRSRRPSASDAASPCPA